MSPPEVPTPICVNMWCSKPLANGREKGATTNKLGYPVCGDCNRKAERKRRLRGK